MNFLKSLFGVKKEPAKQSTDDDTWQTLAVKEICISMIRQIPQEWDSAFLLLEPTEKSIGSGLTHSAITRLRPADFAIPSTDFVMPDADVFAATRVLELGWKARHSTFQRAIIMATRDGESWNIQSEYEHENR